MTLDSCEQLAEARDGFFTDAHPPMMAAIWRVLDAIMSGAFLMLVLQATTLLAGLYLVLRRALSPRAAAIATVVVMLYPPIVNPMAFIWKDSLMAGLVMLGAGLVMSPSRAARLTALGLFCIATAVKYNAFSATFPPMVHAVWLDGSGVYWRPYGAAAVERLTAISNANRAGCRRRKAMVPPPPAPASETATRIRSAACFGKKVFWPKSCKCVAISA